MSLEMKFAIQTVFDILIVILVITGFFYERKLIKFEKRMKLRLAKILYKFFVCSIKRKLIPKNNCPLPRLNLERKRKNGIC